MKIRSSISHWAIAVTCLFVLPAGAQPRLFFVPQGLDPAQFPSGRTQISAVAGARVCVEIYAAAEPYTVQASQASVPPAGTGGDGGSLDIDCASVIIDETHPRFTPEPVLYSVRTVECPEEFAVLMVIKNPGDTLTTGDAGTYVGQVCYDLSGDASGTFALDFFFDHPAYYTM